MTHTSLYGYEIVPVGTDASTAAPLTSGCGHPGCGGGDLFGRCLSFVPEYGGICSFCSSQCEQTLAFNAPGGDA